MPHEYIPSVPFGSTTASRSVSPSVTPGSTSAHSGVMHHISTPLQTYGIRSTVAVTAMNMPSSRQGLNNYTSMSQLAGRSMASNGSSAANYRFPATFTETTTCTISNRGQAVPSQSDNAKRMKLDAMHWDHFTAPALPNSNTTQQQHCVTQHPVNATPVSLPPPPVTTHSIPQRPFQFTIPVPSDTRSAAQHPVFTTEVSLPSPPVTTHSIPQRPFQFTIPAPSDTPSAAQHPLYTTPVIPTAPNVTRNIVRASPFFPPPATVQRQRPRGKEFAHNSARNVDDGTGSSPNDRLQIRAGPGIEKETELIERNRVSFYSLPPDKKRDILRKINEQAPRLIYHCFLPPLPQMDSAPKWCYCGYCRTDWDEQYKSKEYCCNKKPCITKSDEFLSLSFNSENIGTNIPLYSYYKVLPKVEFSDSKFRYQGYRSFILYQFGELGKNVRESPPSCVKSALRYKFPSTDGKYTGFRDPKKDHQIGINSEN